MRKVLLMALMILTVMTAGCGNDYERLTEEEALKMMKSDPNVLVLDVRTQAEYDKKHIPNAVLLPINEIKTGNIAAKLPDKDRKIMTYCWTGRRAEDAADLLSKAGYRNVYAIGGLVNWSGPLEGSGKE